MNHSKRNIYNRIVSGEFNESPYWNQAREEKQRLEREIDWWWKQNPRAHKLSFENWFIYRRQMYNRRIEKLKQKHFNEENKRISTFIKELQNVNPDIDIDLLIQDHEGDLLELYQKVKQMKTN